MKENKTEPRTLAGFMELLPDKQIKFNKMKEIIQKNYEKFGFLPLDTPIIELSEVLLAKAGGETEKQIYSFEKGDKNLSLRFDLTVPLAKYVAMNYGNLSFPFRRYQIGKVYRGERTQRGRFREFYQCDIDIIGDENLSVLHDAELPSIIYNIFKQLDFGDFTICINNRKLFTGLFEYLKLTDKSAYIMRIIDKIDKIGQDNVKKELEELEIDDEKVQTIMKFILTNGKDEEKLQMLKSLNIENETFQKGLEELKNVIENTKILGLPQENLKVDLSIARGLDYYTGTVYETFLNNHREIGSICSGGRYENLADFYTNKKLPGVGISIGLTRLFDQLDNLGLIKQQSLSISKVLIVSMNEDIKKCLEVATILRQNNINTQVYMEDKKIKTKFKYADKLNIPYVIVIGEEEIKENKVTLKNMKTGEQKTEILENIINMIK